MPSVLSPSLSTALRLMLPRSSYRQLQAAAQCDSARGLVKAAAKTVGIEDSAVSKLAAEALRLPFYETLPELTLRHLNGFSIGDFKRTDIFPVVHENRVVAIAGLDPRAISLLGDLYQTLPFVMTSAKAVDGALEKLCRTTEAHKAVLPELVEPLLILLTTAESMNSSRIGIERICGEPGPRWDYSYFSGESCVGIGTLMDSFGDILREFLIAHALTNSRFTHFGYKVGVDWHSADIFLLSMIKSSFDLAKASVLLVDEDTSFLTSTARYLQKNGFTVLSSTRLEDGLGILNENPGIGLVVLNEEWAREYSNIGTENVPKIGAVVWSGGSSVLSLPAFSWVRPLAKHSDPRHLLASLYFLSRFRH